MYSRENDCGCTCHHLEVVHYHYCASIQGIAVGPKLAFSHDGQLDTSKISYEKLEEAKGDYPIKQ